MVSYSDLNGLSHSLGRGQVSANLFGNLGGNSEGFKHVNLY